MWEVLRAPQKFKLLHRLGTDNRVEKDFFSFNSLSILLMVSGRESPFGLTCLTLANPLLTPRDWTSGFAALGAMVSD